MSRLYLFHHKPESLDVLDSNLRASRQVFCSRDSVVLGSYVCCGGCSSRQIASQAALLSYYSLGILRGRAVHHRLSNPIQVNASQDASTANQSKNCICYNSRLKERARVGAGRRWS